MTTLGQLCLLIALVGSGYAAFACLAGWRGQHRAVLRSGLWAAWAAVAALSGASAILARALAAKDFRFEYVAQYSDALLPTCYSLSAFWVGQAGSLLLWAWMVGMLAVVYWFTAGKEKKGDRVSAGYQLQPSPPAPLPEGEGSCSRRGLRELAFGLLMAYACFLVAIMAFAADPMRPSLTARTTGDGLSPLLQHPAMLIHPPVVFLGYAAWGVPFALALAALISGRLDRQWLRQARHWAIFAWLVLGAGILWGAQWAYEELGWGGYWSWDPVENGSLMPWLTGTAFLHGLATWQHCGTFKKTTLGLAVATFGLCNFATFLTRSGIFSSLHAFSQSPVGWMFLALMLLLAMGGVALLLWRRASLTAERPIAAIASLDALVPIGMFALVLLAIVTLVGTLVVPLASALRGPPIVLGAAFYNNVLIPVGLVLLAAVAVTPLVRWRASPTARQRKLLAAAAAAAAAAAGLAFALGVRHPVALAVAGLAAAAVVSGTGHHVPMVGVPFLADGTRRVPATFLIHLGFVALAVGVTGSSLAARSYEASMKPGDVVQWDDYSIRYLDLRERALPEKSVVEAQLEVSEAGATPYPLAPAMEMHRLQNQWRSRVAIHSRWDGDFYAILQHEAPSGKVELTFKQNPMMRWLWASVWIATAGVVAGLLPLGRRGRRGVATRCGRAPGAAWSAAHFRPRRSAAPAWSRRRG
jgi:cytochrome c-type biogenesis protein CcmF